MMKLGDHIDLISGQHIQSEKYSNELIGTPYITGPADFGGFSPRTIGKIVAAFFENGVLTKDEEGYSITDPLFTYYLRFNR